MLQRVIPKPRWEYNTSHWDADLVSSLEHFADKWMNFPGTYFHLPLYSIIGHVEKETPWALQIMKDLPDEVVEELYNTGTTLWVELEWPEDAEDE
ncbi:hypothetical protein VPHD148_0298 [Vibrio phage D148]